MSFFETDYVKPISSTWGYFKPVKGENRVRIITSATVGYIDWDYSWDNPKPVRTKNKLQAISVKATPKHFWAVWVLHEWEVKVWEITQASIQDAIYSLAKDVDWGNPMEYDLVIHREGDLLETKYSIVPKPKKDITEEQAVLMLNTPLNLEALFSWESPFDVKQPEADDVF